MDNTELERIADVYERAIEQIEAILEDDDLTSREKLDAISDVVFGEDEDENQDGNAHEAVE